MFFKVSAWLSNHAVCKIHVGLKEQCHKIFCFRFYSRIIFPQARENNIGVISTFFKNSWRYSQVKVHYRYQRQRATLPLTVVDTSGKFGVNDTDGNLHISVFTLYIICKHNRIVKWSWRNEILLDCHYWYIACSLTGGK